MGRATVGWATMWWATVWWGRQRIGGWGNTGPDQKYWTGGVINDESAHRPQRMRPESRSVAVSAEHQKIRVGARRNHLPFHPTVPDVVVSLSAESLLGFGQQAIDEIG